MWTMTIVGQLLVFLSLTSLSEAIMLIMCSTLMTGMPCDVICDISTRNGSVEFYRDNSLVGGCPRIDNSAVYGCTSMEESYTPLTDNTRKVTLLKISSLEIPRDTGTWKCVYKTRNGDVITSDGKDLKIFDFSESAVTSYVEDFGPGRIYMREKRDVLHIDIILECVYPQPNVSIVTDEPSCVIANQSLSTVMLDQGACANKTYDKRNYKMRYVISWRNLMTQESCVCAHRKLYASVSVYGSLLSVDMERTLKVIDTTECGKLTGFSGVEILPFLTFFISTIFLITLLCRTSSQYIQKTPSDIVEVK